MSLRMRLVVPEGMARSGRVAHGLRDATGAVASEGRGFREVEGERDALKRVVEEFGSANLLCDR